MRTARPLPYGGLCLRMGLSREGVSVQAVSLSRGLYQGDPPEDRQTAVKILPRTKLRLRAVITPTLAPEALLHENKKNSNKMLPPVSTEPLDLWFQVKNSGICYVLVNQWFIMH